MQAIAEVSCRSSGLFTFNFVVIFYGGDFVKHKSHPKVTFAENIST
jgi:hypothetical protein